MAERRSERYTTRKTAPATRTHDQIWLDFVEITVRYDLIQISFQDATRSPFPQTKLKIFHQNPFPSKPNVPSVG